MTTIKHPWMWTATLLCAGICAGIASWTTSSQDRLASPTVSKAKSSSSAVVRVQYMWGPSPTKSAASQPWPRTANPRIASADPPLDQRQDLYRDDYRAAHRPLIQSSTPGSGPLAFGHTPSQAGDARPLATPPDRMVEESHVRGAYPESSESQNVQVTPRNDSTISFVHPGSVAGCASCGSSGGCFCQGCGGVRGCVSAERSRTLQAVARREGCGPEPHWDNAQPLNWEMFGPGEFIGPVRQTPVGQYRIRVNDELRLTYLLSRDELPEYRLQVGDKIMVESGADENVERDVEVMPDGRVSLYLLGYIHVAGLTIPEVSDMLNDLYVRKRLIINPRVTVTGVEVNTLLKDVQATVDARQGAGGTGITVPVMPDGTINLVSLPRSICCQGLTVMELQTEINARYREQVGGLTVTVALETLAPKYVYVMGEVGNPDRYQLQGPTRVSQALALAGGPQLSGNQRQIVVVRHTPEWGTIATRLDLRGFLLGKRPAPSDDVWVRDQDIIIVPKHPIQRANDVINLLFTNGLYATIPELGGFAQTGLFGTGTLLGN